MLIDKSSSILWGFSLIGFNKYNFDKDNKLILSTVYYVNPSHKEKGNIEELLQNSITKLL